MTEQEYINVENETKIKTALKILESIDKTEDNIDAETLGEVRLCLRSMKIRLSKVIKLEESE